MSKKLINKIKESLFGLDQKSSDFNKTKEVLFSVKSKQQLTSAVKFINNFNNKYKISETSPEFIYFDRMVRMMKNKLRSNKYGVDGNTNDSERVTSNLRNTIKESLTDFKWIQDSEPTFKPGFPFDGREQWIDLTNVNNVGREKIINYIKEVLLNIGRDELDQLEEILQDSRINGIIIHCGIEYNNYRPKENELCSISRSYENDYVGIESHIPHIYLDGREILYYIELLGDKELDESLGWSDKDNSFGEKDKKFEPDSTWINDSGWESNPDRSYWKQGTNSGGVNESSDWDLVRDNSISGKQLRELMFETGATSIPFDKVYGDLDLWGTQIQDLGNLQSVGGYLYLEETQIKSLGNLQSVGGDLDLRRTPIQDLGNLQSVGGYLILLGTPFSKKYSEAEIRTMVQVEGNIYL